MQQRERLNSWKEIAAHLSVTVRTAQRWEKTERLPVRRHKHAALSSVFAYRDEIESWWNSRPDLRLSTEPSPSNPSIAVLPFVNLSREERDEILSDGLTEELISSLMQVEGLRVIARTSVFHFKGRSDDVRTIGAQLGVKSVLEGSVRRSGERLRISAQLINAADGCHLWSERYDRGTADFLDLQDEIAEAIAAALRVELTADGARHDTRDPEAYTRYLEGRFYLHKRTPQALQHAVRMFEKALERDHRMAPAWAALADCYSMLPGIAGLPAAENLARAKAAALKALEIDRRRAEAHSSLGMISALYEYDWAAAERHFLRALELNAELADAHLLYGALVLAPAGRRPEAEAHFQRALEIDPLSAAIQTALGMQLLMSRDFDRAIAACSRALELDPAYPWAHRAAGEAWLLLNRFDDALAAFSRIDSPAFAMGYVGYCHARSGNRSEALRLRSELEKTAPLAYQSAVLDLGLGDRDAALVHLNEACGLPSLGIHWLKIDPIWDELRDDPRFTAVLTRLGL